MKINLTSMKILYLASNPELKEQDLDSAVTSGGEVEMDSLSMFELGEKISETFGKRLPDEKLTLMRYPKDFIAWLGVAFDSLEDQ